MTIRQKLILALASVLLIVLLVWLVCYAKETKLVPEGLFVRRENPAISKEMRIASHFTNRG